MTNATKAVIILVLNSAISLVTSFGVSISDAQTTAITGFANAVLLCWIALTYKDSPARSPFYDLPDEEVPLPPRFKDPNA